MESAHTISENAIVRLADGTVKQQNMLTGTEVWTIPGRGDRPMKDPDRGISSITARDHSTYCAFCSDRYFETPPEKSRVIRDEQGRWHTLTDLPAEELRSTRAEFRRIPNLFEIVSYNYWHLNHGHVPSEQEGRRMATYLASSQGFDHVMRVVRARMLAAGISPEDWESLDDSTKLQQANGFFSGGHDLVVARRHFVDGATVNTQLASAGTLTPDEHEQYIRMSIQSLRNLYDLDPAVAYVSVFQNWLKAAGASFDHLHKQLVAIDELPVQIQAEMSQVNKIPNIYDEMLRVGATRKLIIAQNDHAIAIAGFGHRFPSIAVWALHAPVNPWDASDAVVRGVSDILQAVHRATGADVACNEEWYHQPLGTSVPLRWRILVKWRLSTVAGFEGGTRIYLNTMDPWDVYNHAVTRMQELRKNGEIAPMLIGDECKVDPEMLRD